MSSFHSGFGTNSRDYNLNQEGGRRRNPSFSSSGPNPINPWEGVSCFGVNTSNVWPTGGLLPTPNINAPTGGLLQHFSTHNTQAQLVLASKVLSAFLPTVQNSQVNPLSASNFNHGGLASSSGLRVGGDNVGPVRRKSRGTVSRPDPYNKRQITDDHNGTSTFFKMGTQEGMLEGSEKCTARNSSKKICKKKMEREDRSYAMGDKNASAFAGIPSVMLHCTICKKRMLDAASFTNHLKGRAHQLMLDQLEDKYKADVELMREEIQVAEQRRKKEFERKHGKACVSKTRDFCTMCNLCLSAGSGGLLQHRKSEPHQKLKTFLHPSCDLCCMEFSSRLDWNNHQFTPGHLKILYEIKHCSKYLKSYPQLKAREIQNKMSLHSKSMQEESVLNEEEQQKERELTQSDQNKSHLQNSHDTGIQQIVKDHCKQVSESTLKNFDVKDFNQPEIQKLEDKMPSESSIISRQDFVFPNYDSSKEIGSDLIQEQTSYLCRCCNQFIFNQTDVKTHCCSLYHYEKYITYLENEWLVNHPHTIVSSALMPLQKKLTDSPQENSNGKPTDSPIAKLLPGQSKSPTYGEEGKDVLENDYEEDKEEDYVNWKRRRSCQEVKDLIMNQVEYKTLASECIQTNEPDEKEPLKTGVNREPSSPGPEIDVIVITG